MKCNLDVTLKTAQLILGLGGLILGICYYHLRKNFFLINEKKQRVRNRLDHIIDELNKIDGHVRTLFKSKIPDRSELIDVKNSLDAESQWINLYLEINDELLGFSKDELGKLVSVGSFIEKVVYSQDDQDGSSLDSTTYQYYIQMLQEARAVCLKKMEYV